MENKGLSIVFATNNEHKLKEVREILGDKFKVISLSEAGINTEIPEDFETLEENAMQKAEFIFNKTGLPSFADDTGLEVDALGGLPGVYSARYAGEAKDPAENVKKLLKELSGTRIRNARFRCVIAYITDKGSYCFEGIVNGKITDVQAGSGGFGYDPVFIPDGYKRTFAELLPEEKNAISHRGRAVSAFSEFLLNSMG